MKSLAIIPARAGSKGIPGKNIKDMCGKPLIAWSIEAALQSASVERVLVSTDSEEIQDIAKKYGAEAPFLRPEALSTDSATTESAMIHCLDWLMNNEGYSPEAVTLLQATSPIRANNAVDAAHDAFGMAEATSLLSVCDFWHFLWAPGDPPIAQYDYRNRPRRQDITPEGIRYKENGSIYITKPSCLKRFTNRLSDRIALFHMTEEESFEIDSELDWVIVEAILSRRLAAHAC